MLPVTAVFGIENSMSDESAAGTSSRGGRGVGDPFINITQPMNNSMVNGTIKIKGNAWDDFFVTNVTVKINSISYMATDTSGNFSWYSWEYSMDTTAYANGWMEIRAYVFDNISNSMDSINVNINNTAPPNLAPRITITSPTNNSIVKNSITIAGIATDDQAVINVTVKVSGTDYYPVDTSGNGTWYKWQLEFNTTILSNQNHLIIARALDGNLTGTDVIMINVDNTPININLPPSVAITKPLNNTVQSGIVVIEGTSRDDNSVLDVSIEINSMRLAAVDTSGNGSWYTWNYALDTTQYNSGWLMVEAIAFDGNLSTSTYIMILINETTQPNKPPWIWITDPANGTEVNGIIKITGKSVDDTGVTEVKVTINGTDFIPNDTSGNGTLYTWELEYNTTVLADREYIIVARAGDGSLFGYHAIIILVNNTITKPDNIAPLIFIDEPDEGMIVSGIITIEGRAWDLDGPVLSVRVNIDGSFYDAIDDSSNGSWYLWSLEFNTTVLENGIHTIKATAYDETTFTEAEISIIVNNEYLPPDRCPYITISKPLPDSELNGTIDISGLAWDDIKVTDVKIMIDGHFYVPVDTSSNSSWNSWSYYWNTSGMKNGLYKITAIAFDENCNSSEKIWIRLNNPITKNGTGDDEVTVDEEEDDDNEPPPSYAPPTSRFDAVDTAAASIAVIAIIGIFGILAYAVEGSRYKILSYFAVPLYTRLKKNKVLENFTRGKIYGFICAHPGTYFNHIKLTLALNNGTLAYHLSVLERDELVTSQNDGVYRRRFYPTEGRLPFVDGGNGKVHTYVQLNSTQNNIFKIIKDKPGLSQKDIAKLINKSTQVVNYNISTMAEKGLIKLEREGKITRCYAQELYPVNESLGAVELKK
jgi:predicted transcriptional regulator